LLELVSCVLVCVLGLWAGLWAGGCGLASLPDWQVATLDRPASAASHVACRPSPPTHASPRAEHDVRSRGPWSRRCVRRSRVTWSFTWHAIRRWD